MNIDSRNPDTDGNTLAEAVEQVTARMLDGEWITERELQCEFPQFADQLRELLPTIVTMQNWGKAEPASAAHGAIADNSTDNEPLGDFQIIREIGRGGMGIVYEAQQKSLGRRVAVKVLPLAALVDQRQLERFKNEARAAAMLKHRHIVGVHAVGYERGVHFYAMELILGCSLADVIAANHSQQRSSSSHQRPRSGGTVKLDKLNKQTDTVPIARLSTEYSSNRPRYFRMIAQLGFQVAEAIEFAHQHGVIHRDIKPSNLLLDKVGDIHVSDFGLAWSQDVAELTLTGDIVGTLRYMSPEQLESASNIDQRTDVYSLGATLYEAICGRPVVDGASKAELMRGVIDHEPVHPVQIDARIPTDLATIVMKCLKKQPQDRYETVRQLGEDLQRFHDRRPILAKRSSRWKNFWRWTQRHRRLAIVSTVAIVALLTLAISGPIVAWNLNQSLRSTNVISQELKAHDYDMRIRDAAHAVESIRYSRAEKMLTQCPLEMRAFEWSYLWNKVKADKRRTITQQPIDLLRVAIRPDNRQIACGNWFGRILLFDRDSRKQTGHFSLNPEDQAIPHAICYSPDGAWLFVGGEKQACLWDVQNSTVAIRWTTQENICDATSVTQPFLLTAILRHANPLPVVLVTNLLANRFVTCRCRLLIPSLNSIPLI